MGTVATIDPDPGDTTFTYTLVGNDAAFFDFNASSGELSLKAASSLQRPLLLMLFPNLAL